MYKVFFKDSCFLLTDDRNLLKESDTRLVHRNCTVTQTFIGTLLQRRERFTAVLFDEDEERLFSIFQSCFRYVQAAGGAVIQAENILLIRRLGKYDLPKGHQETGETTEACAVREVEEECGLKEVRITAPLTDTFHIYHRNGNWHLKKTCWYAMSCPPGQTPVPQTEEDIEEVFWFPLKNTEKILSGTYPSLVAVFRCLHNKSTSVP